MCSPSAVHLLPYLGATQSVEGLRLPVTSQQAAVRAQLSFYNESYHFDLPNTSIASNTSVLKLLLFFAFKH